MVGVVGPRRHALGTPSLLRAAMAPSLCGHRKPPAVLQWPWNETRAVREHKITFVHGHPPFQMRLRPSNYDEDNWSNLIRERERSEVTFFVHFRRL